MAMEKPEVTLKIVGPRTCIGTSPCFEKQRRCSDKLFVVPMWLVTAVSFTFLLFGKRRLASGVAAVSLASGVVHSGVRLAAPTSG